MTCRGHVKNGVVVLDDPIVLPDGAEVDISLRESGPILTGLRDPCSTEAALHQTIEEEIARIVSDVAEAQWDRLPADLNEQLDHYIYGTPKR